MTTICFAAGFISHPDYFCYPNIGKTGLRDFEHFIGFNDSPKKLYEYIGTHLISLALVAGSCFRNRDTTHL